jgi:hypothetical protein
MAPLTERFRSAAGDTSAILFGLAATGPGLDAGLVTYRHDTLIPSPPSRSAAG